MNDSFTHVTGKFLVSLSQVFPEKLVVRNGSFVTVVSESYQEIKSITVRHRVSGNGNTLIAGIYDDAVINDDEITTKKHATIFATCLLKQYREYAGELVHFSKSRNIGDRKLYQDTHFHQVIGEILKLIELTELSLSVAELTLVNLTLAFRHLAQIGDRCVKALGGRSLLSGSVFDLQVICHLVGNTYVK